MPWSAAHANETQAGQTGSTVCAASFNEVVNTIDGADSGEADHFGLVASLPRGFHALSLNQPPFYNSKHVTSRLSENFCFRKTRAYDLITSLCIAVDVTGPEPQNRRIVCNIEADADSAYRR